MRRALSSASLGLLYGGVGGVVGDVFIDQGITVDERKESVSALSSDQLDLTVVDKISIIEIVDNKANIELITQEGEVNAE